MTPKQSLLAFIGFLGTNFVGAAALPIHNDPTKQADPAAYPNGWVELAYECGPTGGDGSSTFGVDQSYYRSRDALTATVRTPRTRGAGPAWDAAELLRSLLLERDLGEARVDTVLPASPEELGTTDTHFSIEVVAIVIREEFFTPPV